MRLKLFTILLVIATSLSACSIGRRADPTPTPSAVVPPSPTAIPTPDSPLAILVVPTDMDKTASDAYQKAVYDLAQGSGMRFQVRNSCEVSR